MLKVVEFRSSAGRIAVRPEYVERVIEGDLVSDRTGISGERQAILVMNGLSVRVTATYDEALYKLSMTPWSGPGGEGDG